MKTKVYTLAVWGTVQSSDVWPDWFRFMEGESKVLGAPLTHYGIEGGRLSTKKIRSIDKLLKIQAELATSDVESLSGYSLPKNFQTAVFDYEIYMILCESYAVISVKEDFAESVLKKPVEWKLKLSRFCSVDKGMLFQMDEDEVPLMYVSGACSQEEFDSMSVLKEFD